MGFNEYQIYGLVMAFLVLLVYHIACLFVLRKTKARMDVSALLSMLIFSLVYITEGIFWLYIATISYSSQDEELMLSIKYFISQSHIEEYLVNVAIFYFVFEMRVIR